MDPLNLEWFKKMDIVNKHNIPLCKYWMKSVFNVYSHVLDLTLRVCAHLYIWVFDVYINSTPMKKWEYAVDLTHRQ